LKISILEVPLPRQLEFRTAKSLMLTHQTTHRPQAPEKLTLKLTMMVPLVIRKKIPMKHPLLPSHKMTSRMKRFRNWKMKSLRLHLM